MILSTTPNQVRRVEDFIVQGPQNTKSGSNTHRQSASVKTKSQCPQEDNTDQHLVLISRTDREPVVTSLTSSLVKSTVSTSFQFSQRFRRIETVENRDEMAVKSDVDSTTAMQERGVSLRGSRHHTFPSSAPLSHSRQESWLTWSVSSGTGTGNESWRRHFRSSKTMPGESQKLEAMSALRRDDETAGAPIDSRNTINQGLPPNQASRQPETFSGAADAANSHRWKWHHRYSSEPVNRSIPLPYTSNRMLSVRPSPGRGYHDTHAQRTYNKTGSEYPLKWKRISPPNLPQERRHFSVVSNGESVVVSKRPTDKHTAPSIGVGWIEKPKDNKRPLSPSVPPLVGQNHLHQSLPPTYKKVKGFDKLDLLCSATLGMGELYDNPTGCSCPKSKCIALYCDCFKAGRRCDPDKCKCLDCKNTVAESGADGARTKAIRCILARNPRAFTTAGIGNPTLKLPPGEVACNCVRSRCLKLYCSCFQNSKMCNPKVCTCVGCYNTDIDDEGHRTIAIQQYLERRPDAFDVKKPKEIGLGCACKNNRCIRKYCECFRTNIACTSKCTCRQCENGKKQRQPADASTIINTCPSSSSSSNWHGDVKNQEYV